MYDVVSYSPQLGALTYPLEQGLSFAGSSPEEVLTGKKPYNPQMKTLGNLGRLYSTGATIGKIGRGDADGLDLFYLGKSWTPFSNLYYLDQLYKDTVKEELR